MIRIAEILMPIHSLGPGERIGLWTQGCRKHCIGCISPEMQEHQGEGINEQKLAEMLSRMAAVGHCSGITISGGDPLEQGKALLLLLKQIRPVFRDILVYTGFCMEEILLGVAGEEAKECLSYIDVLIDGRYVEDLNFSETVLRGSENQVIYFLNENLRETYESYMSKGRILETFTHHGKLMITGIMNRRTEDE